MAAKPAKPDDIVVFSILKASQCGECDTELAPGALLKKEGEIALCLSCADLGHLVFLPQGNAALTRRASKYTTLRAIVVRFSRSRKRYERQGILVEEPALERAESDCLADADAREQRRLRAAVRREEQDAAFVTEFTNSIQRRYPGCPAAEAAQIAGHACQKYSGRVGRSAAAKDFAPESTDLAVAAHVRHCHTPYDALLAQGWERQAARGAVWDAVQAVLENWS
ncbi:DUF2293 domain-containing protein [Nodosilinea sp. P-1105]|uniref:DUF2293 domain-containing protein n=1 Tax=Nodosilinea sp. P-1105 TaxID=2546229 RepID=UPI00146B19ED|nr:DUF2293 domain-containing protein [Nodosilinea sp. P-1105]NMF83456.1 DUF2293 domain-containing protein [Nodosilinea sp. P-1105]